MYTKGANDSLEAEKCHYQIYKVCSEECTMETEHQLEGYFNGRWNSVYFTYEDQNGDFPIRNMKALYFI